MRHADEGVSHAVVEAAAQNLTEAVAFVDQCARRSVVRQRRRNLELETVQGMARLCRVVFRSERNPYPCREVFLRGLEKIAGAEVRRNGENRQSRRLVMERREQRHTIGEPLVECRGLEEIAVE